MQFLAVSNAGGDSLAAGAFIMKIVDDEVLITFCAVTGHGDVFDVEGRAVCGCAFR